MLCEVEAASSLPRWDGLSPDGTNLDGTCLDYLGLLEKVGAWCGNLEWYSLAKGLPLNLLVLDYNFGQYIKFPAASDVDPFVVLKFSAGHYEWVNCDSVGLVELWQQATVGSTSGGRGGGFMDFMDLSAAASSSSATRRRQDLRMDLSAAASAPPPSGRPRR